MKLICAVIIIYKLLFLYNISIEAMYFESQHNCVETLQRETCEFYLGEKIVISAFLLDVTQ